MLPWGAPKERTRFPSSVHIETDIKPGEFVMRTLFAEFTITAERKITLVMSEPLDRGLAKSLQRGEDPHFDQVRPDFILVLASSIVRFENKNSNHFNCSSCWHSVQ